MFQCSTIILLIHFINILQEVQFILILKHITLTFSFPNPAITVGNTIQTNHLQALTLLDYFHKSGCLCKTIMRPLVQPGKAMAFRLHSA